MMKPSLFPALTTNQPLRLLTVTAMYFAQGIQTGLLLTAIPAYLASQAVDPVAIGGFIGVVMLPWTFKLISAPLMDRFSIVVNLDLMLDNIWTYVGHFLIRPGEYIVELIKRASEACNFLRIAICSNLDVFHNACLDRNINEQCLRIISHVSFFLQHLDGRIG